MKNPILLTTFALLLSQLSYGSFILTEVGNGTASLPGAGSSITVTFPSAITVNRGAAGFGDHTTTVEGAYFTYQFTAPDVDNGGGNDFSNFDAQNQMGGIWSGWGDALNGPWQNGPTTGTWNRANRRQHMYDTGSNGTSTFFPTMGGTPGDDPSVPLSGLSQPDRLDVLKVSVFLNAVDNTILSVYENITKSESFSYLTTDSGMPSTGNLAFNNLVLRSDGGVPTMDYTYGTLVVPEPSTMLLTAFAGLGAVMRRRRVA